MADNSSLMFSLQSVKVVSTSQLHITGFITMALFQPMHGAAIQASPIPTALADMYSMYINMVWSSHFELGRMTVCYHFKFTDVSSQVALSTCGLVWPATTVPCSAGGRRRGGTV